MENARSLASRFSGLILFLMSLAVVGVLVYLTIESANDDSADNGDNTVTQVDSEASENSVSGSGEESAGNDSNTSSATSDTGSTPNTGGDEDSDVAAATTDEPLPNTGPESALASAIALGGLVFAARAYLSSRRELAQLNRR